MNTVKDRIDELEKGVLDLKYEYMQQQQSLRKAYRAIHAIAPWLSASLSDPRMTPCDEYKDACNDIFNIDALYEE